MPAAKQSEIRESDQQLVAVSYWTETRSEKRDKRERSFVLQLFHIPPDLVCSSKFDSYNIVAIENEKRRACVTEKKQTLPRCKKTKSELRIEILKQK